MVLVSTSELRAAKAYTPEVAVRTLSPSIIAEKLARSGDYRSRRGWRLKGIHLTGCPDPEYPYDLGNVRRFRLLDPSLVPVFRKILMVAPSGGLHTFPHHGLAIADPNACPIDSFRSLPMPDPCEWPRPTSMVRWLTGAYVPGSHRERLRLPKPFIPYGEWIVRWVEETKWDARAQEKQEWAAEHGREAVARKAREFEESEAAYRGKTEVPYQRGLMSKFGEDDWRELKARMRGEVKEDPKPFVHLGSGSGTATAPAPAKE